MSSTSTILQPSEAHRPNHPGLETDSIELFPVSREAPRPLESTVTDGEAPEHATEAVPDGGYGWTIVAASFVLNFWINGYITAWGVIQTAIVQTAELKTDIRTITFVGSLCMACIVFFGLISVRIMDLFGVRYTSLVAVTIFGLGLVATSFTLHHLAGLFCVAGALIGCGASLLFTATNVLPIQWFSSRLGMANGLVKAGGGVGATVIPIATQGLIDKLGMAWTVRTLGFMTLATGIPCAWLLKDRMRTRRASRFNWSQLKEFPFLVVTIAGAVGVFGLYVPPYFLPLFARSIGLSSSVGAGLVAGFGASTAVGRVLGGWACDRIGSFNALAISALINSVTMLAIWPVSTSLPPLFVFALINGCTNGSFFVALPTAVAALAPGSAATAISLMTSFWTPGYLLGTPLAGILIDATGAADASSIGPYRAAIFYAAGTGALATFLAVLARLRLDTKLIKKL